MPTFRDSLSPARPAERSLRVALGGGRKTTVHVLRLPRFAYAARVVRLSPAARLRDWCERSGTGYALIGGFYVRATGIPLGALQIGGRAVPSAPFDSPWDRIRACVHCQNGTVSLRSRLELPGEPRGDLMQAGPMLVRSGVRLVEPGADPEGFSAGSRQFDSDITVGRYPRAALGLSADELIAVVCEGRTDDEAGLTLTELAQAMIELGAEDAINLDGGGSASLIAGGRLVNTPREEGGAEIPGGREVPTALRFTLR
jgi:hypothetical protein